MSTCAACPSGKFSNEAGKTVCEVCGISAVVRHTGHAAGSASSLRAGHAAPGAGSHHPAHDNGATHLHAGTGCTSCTTPSCDDWEFLFDCRCSACPGEYPAGREPSMSQECECSDCGIGSSRPDNTELFCTLCPPGTHQASNGMATCDPCAAGQYSQETGRSMCTDCDAGTYSTAPGAVSAAACLACDPGKYSSSTGSDAETACQACPDHSGNNPAGSTSLASCKCNAGWAGAGGGPVCAVCPAGKISNTTGAVFCQRNVTRTCTPCP